MKNKEQEIQKPDGMKNGQMFTSNGEQFIFLKEQEIQKQKKRFEPWNGKQEPTFETVGPWDGKTERV